MRTIVRGPEARGGASRSEVVLGRGEIDVLHAPAVDVLVCLNQASEGEAPQGGVRGEGIEGLQSNL